MVKVVWDASIPPSPTSIQRWDEWFALVGLTEAWEVVKVNFEDEQQRLNWAAMIELTRISEKEKLEGKVGGDGD